MILKDTGPSSPIGVQWDFKPRSAVFTDLSIRTAAIDVWSLPLEAVMSYGGVLSDFVRDIATRSQLAFRSGESTVGQAESWDLVHRSQLSETLNSMLPAYVSFDALTLTASQLSAFEKAMYRETDAVVVLPAGRDLIFLKELLAHTRLQLSLDLDDLPDDERDRATVLEMVFKDPLRVAEIRIRPTNEQMEFWQTLVFETSCSSAVILKWDEDAVPWSQVNNSILHLQALRANVQRPPFHEAPPVNETGQQKRSALENAFADIFPQLRQVMKETDLKHIWSDFLEALGEDGAHEWEPYAQLRLWPMFLKMHAPRSHVDLAQTEWARFSAEFHPADEKAEREKLNEGELKANPTLQIIRKKDELVVIARTHHLDPARIYEQAIDWLAAALLDEVSEAPKISETALLHHVTDVVAPSGPRPNAQEWRSALEHLIATGVVLRKNLS